MPPLPVLSLLDEYVTSHVPYSKGSIMEEVPQCVSLLANEHDQLLLTTRVRDPSSICCTYIQNIMIF